MGTLSQNEAMKNTSLPRAAETMTRCTIRVTGTTNVHPCKLVRRSAGGTRAVLVRDGAEHEAVRTRGGWKLTGSYTYR